MFVCVFAKKFPALASQSCCEVSRPRAVGEYEYRLFLAHFYAVFARLRREKNGARRLGTFETKIAGRNGKCSILTILRKFGDHIRQSKSKISLSTCHLDKLYIKFGCPKPKSSRAKRFTRFPSQMEPQYGKVKKNIFNLIFSSMRFAFMTIRKILILL